MKNIGTYLPFKNNIVLGIEKMKQASFLTMYFRVSTCTFYIFTLVVFESDEQSSVQ